MFSCLWAKAGPPRMSCQFIAGPQEEAVGLVRCSRAPWQSPEGVLAPSPTTKSPALLGPVPHRLSYRCPSLILH